MTEIAWEVVARFLQRAPADVVWSILDGHGIPARVRGEDAAGYVGLAVADVWVEVPAERAEEAAALLASGDDPPPGRSGAGD